MKFTRIAAGTLLILSALVAVAPTAFASSTHAGIKWAAVGGKLSSYNAGSKATVTVTTTTKGVRTATTTTLTVNLSTKTKVMYGSKKTAAPLVITGDGVRVLLKWKGSTASATSVTYLPNGQVPSSSGKGQNGTSEFHGRYSAGGSSSTLLALTTPGNQTVSFTVSPNTVYFESGLQIANPTLTDGQHIAVEATQQADGSWAATTVLVGDRHGDKGGQGEDEDFGGKYVSSTATTLTLTDQDGNADQTFTLDTSTQYFDANGTAVSSLTYAAGERLHVNATQQPDGTWLATKVSVSNKDGHGGGDDGGNGTDHHFKGTYVSSTATSVTVADGDGNTETFSVDANTMYFDATGNAVASLSYTAGQKLFITASHQSDGSWLASQVSLKSPHGNQSGGDQETEDFGGAYSADTPTSLTVTTQDGDNNTVTFTLDANTEYIDASGNKVSSLTYTAGEHLHVQAVQQSDGSWLATMVSAFVHHDD